MALRTGRKTPPSSTTGELEATVGPSIKKIKKILSWICWWYCHEIIVNDSHDLGSLHHSNCFLWYPDDSRIETTPAVGECSLASECEALQREGPGEVNGWHRQFQGSRWSKVDCLHWLKANMFETQSGTWGTDSHDALMWSEICWHSQTNLCSI